MSFSIVILPTEGVSEIWLTSEDTGAYGIDIGVTIVELLDQLVEVIPEGCMMRIGMTNPPYILDHLEVGLTSRNKDGKNCRIPTTHVIQTLALKQLFGSILLLNPRMNENIYIY